MIEAIGLSKRYGKKTAVDQVSFTVRPGRVTGFLGPNGAGKSTTMRMICGLDRPSAGTVTVNGKKFVDHPAPITQVGVLLDAKGIHPGRSARAHLAQLALTHGIPKSRVDEVLELTGLTAVARRRVGGFSLGMSQRLGIAGALLGDPEVLILDEPVNGLDPEGVKWVREMARSQADLGRTVFISSHLMSEMAQTATDLIIIGRGKIIRTGTVAEILAESSEEQVRVTSPNIAQLVSRLPQTGVSVTAIGPNTGIIYGLSAPQIGALAATGGFVLHELTPQTASLEQAYLSLTSDEVEYRTEKKPAFAPVGRHFASKYRQPETGKNPVKAVPKTTTSPVGIAPVTLPTDRKN